MRDDGLRSSLMRIWILVVAWLFGACSASAALVVPVTIVGDGESDVLLAHEICPASNGALARSAEACKRASEVEHWAELSDLMGGALAARSPDEMGFEDRQFVAVALPTCAALVGIVVSSEEGVDVITLDVTAGDVPGSVCLLQMSRRMCQMAIILRDQQLGKEHTVAVYSGL